MPIRGKNGFIGLLTITFTSILLIGCGKGSGPTQVSDPSASATVSPNYVLVWSDEFDGNSLDAAKWNIETGYGSDGWGNDEWQNYTNSPNNVHLENGALIITARCDSGVPGKRDGSITSARINTKGKFSSKFGKIQARIQPPEAAGMWPAFWMLGANIDTSPWPKCGEIDIMEMDSLYEDDKTTLCTLHWWDDSLVPPDWTYLSKKKSFPYSLTKDYHIFEVDWDENRIIGKIDGQEYFVKSIDPTTMDEFLKDFFILLNVAVGGTHGGSPYQTDWQNPPKMYVDWVRVYKKVPSTAGIYTESQKDATIKYKDITDSGNSGGNRAVPNQISKGVPPFDGTNVLSVAFSDAGKTYGGITLNFSLADISNYSTLVFSIDNSGIPDLHDLGVKLEGVAPVTYTLAGFAGAEDSSIQTDPVDVNNSVARVVRRTDATETYAGTVVSTGAKGSVPKIPFTTANKKMTARVYMPATGIPVRLKVQNSGEPDNAKVTTCEVEVPTTGANAWQTLTFDFASPVAGTPALDVSKTYDQVVIFFNFGITGADDGGKTYYFDDLAFVGGTWPTLTFFSGNKQVQLASYTPTRSGNWDTYEVPLRDFAGVNLTQVLNLGFWNPVDNSSKLVFGTLYIDDIYLRANTSAYLYATDDQVKIEFVAGRDYTGIDNGGSGSVIDNQYAVDNTYKPVIKIANGTGWGTPTAAIAFTGFGKGFSIPYTALRFKIKLLPTSIVYVAFASGTGPQFESFYDLSTYATAIGTTGWYEVTIPLSDFPDRSIYTEFAIHGGLGNGGTFYLTDVYFTLESP